MELWVEAWPLVPWEDATPEDKHLFLVHSLSLADYEGSKR